jgi:hypothetical protein
MRNQTILHYKILAKLGEACPAAGQGRHVFLNEKPQKLIPPGGRRDI